MFWSLQTQALRNLLYLSLHENAQLMLQKDEPLATERPQGGLSRCCEVGNQDVLAKSQGKGPIGLSPAQPS